MLASRLESLPLGARAAFSGGVASFVLIETRLEELERSMRLLVNPSDQEAKQYAAMYADMKDFAIRQAQVKALSGSNTKLSQSPSSYADASVEACLPPHACSNIYIYIHFIYTFVLFIYLYSLRQPFTDTFYEHLYENLHEHLHEHLYKHLYEHLYKYLLRRAAQRCARRARYS